MTGSSRDPRTRDHRCGDRRNRCRGASATPAVPLSDHAAPLTPEPDYDERGNPSFDYIRAKIEGRAATALGSTELAGDLPETRTVDEKMAERDKKAADKLAEMRKSLGLS